jgi:hypothetical protein
VLSFSSRGTAVLRPRSPEISRSLKKREIWASSFDKLRMRLSVFNELILMVSLSRFGGLTVRPWATSFFSNLLEAAHAFVARLEEASTGSCRFLFALLTQTLQPMKIWPKTEPAAAIVNFRSCLTSELQSCPFLPSRLRA